MDFYILDTNQNLPNILKDSDGDDDDLYCCLISLDRKYIVYFCFERSLNHKKSRMFTEIYGIGHFIQILTFDKMEWLSWL